MRNGQALVSVTDDDRATLMLALASSSISERDGQMLVTVTRNTPPTTALLVNLSSNPGFELSLPSSVTIATGALSTSFTVQALDNTLAAGNQSVSLTASAAGFINGSGVITLVDDDLPALRVTLGAAFVSESSRTTTARVTRNTPTSQALVVSIAGSEPTAATPAATTVTIPAGAASAQFEIGVIDDAIADGTQLAVLTASADGFVNGSATLNVTDDDVASLRLSTSTTRFSENAGSTTITVARNTPLASDQLVSFQTNASSVISFPSSVTIPAGAESTTVVVTGLDDALAFGDRNATFSAASAGLAGATMLLTIIDDDIAALSLTILAQSLSENGGRTNGRVERNSPIDQPLAVTLTANMPGVLSVPTTITILPGATFATFVITTVDDLVAEGPRVVEIAASTVGLTPSTALLEVLDDDAARLTLTLASNSVMENGGSISASIRRNTPLAAEQIVQLSSSDTSRVVLPASITIPSGAESTTFPINIVDDSNFNSNATVLITASAIGFASASASLLIVEDETNWPWHNAQNPLDVNADGFITAFDALLVINHLNRGGTSRLPDPTDGNNPPPYLDVNRDGQSTAIDALLVINRLNQGGGAEGESLILPLQVDHCSWTMNGWKTQSANAAQLDPSK